MILGIPFLRNFYLIFDTVNDSFGLTMHNYTRSRYMQGLNYIPGKKTDPITPNTRPDSGQVDLVKILKNVIIILVIVVIILLGKSAIFHNINTNIGSVGSLIVVSKVQTKRTSIVK